MDHRVGKARTERFADLRGAIKSQVVAKGHCMTISDCFWSVVISAPI